MKSLINLYLVFSLCSLANAEINSTMSSNFRIGYQYGVDSVGSGNELAIVATIGYETKRWNHILVGGAISALEGGSNGNGGYFIHGVKNDILLLSEAYIKGFYGNNEVIMGRQLLETPFVNSDDIGMIPNRFGGVMLVNESLVNTKFTAGYINSIAVGTDDKKQAIFDPLGIYVLGLEYCGIDNLAFGGWYYQNLNELRVSYLDAQYDAKMGRINYEIAVQYANQHIDNKIGNIYGGKILLGDETSGVSINSAYTKTVGAAANNLYGGGPWYTSVEHSTIADIGNNGSAFKLGINMDNFGMIDGLSFGIEKLWLKDNDDTIVSNSGIMVRYRYTDSVVFRGYYNKISDNRENGRIFVDYKF